MGKRGKCKRGNVQNSFALENFTVSTGGIYPETLTDRQFLVHLPNGQLPGNPYKDNTCISVAEEKAVSDPLNYALKILDVKVREPKVRLIIIIALQQNQLHGQLTVVVRMT